MRDRELWNLLHARDYMREQDEDWLKRIHERFENFPSKEIRTIIDEIEEEMWKEQGHGLESLGMRRESLNLKKIIWVIIDKRPWDVKMKYPELYAFYIQNGGLSAPDPEEIFNKTNKEIWGQLTRRECSSPIGCLFVAESTKMAIDALEEFKKACQDYLEKYEKNIDDWIKRQEREDSMRRLLKQFYYSRMNETIIQLRRFIQCVVSCGSLVDAKIPTENTWLIISDCEEELISFKRVERSKRLIGENYPEWRIHLVYTTGYLKKKQRIPFLAGELFGTSIQLSPLPWL